MELNLLEIQDKILEIAVYFDEFCREHEITYYLMGGSALGAVRHEGFIPWDDDLDVFMTFENYKKFLNVCESHLDREKFYLQKENTEEWPLFFSKLRMNNTTFIEEDTQYRKMHKGFYIDVMCLNNTTKNKFFRYLQYFAAKIVISKTLYERGYSTNNKVKKVAMGLSKIVINKTIIKLLLMFIRSLNSFNTQYVGHFFGRAKFKNTSFPKKYLGQPKYTKFSKVALPVPFEVEKYLAVRFGSSFMDMPSKKVRDQYPSHAIYADPNVDYKVYDNSNSLNS